MVVAGAAQVIVDTTAALAVVFVASGVVATWALVRRVRRRVSRWRVAVGAVASLPVSDPRWWVTQKDRHRLWRAVGGAERAVRAARSAQAPTGDLPHLVRRLREAARSVDAALRADLQRLGRPGAARRQLQEVIDTAADIQRAAVGALMSVAEPETASIAEAVRVEIRALAHGVAVASSRH